ncbi:hypothetical protein BV898_05881 [Hypsibius exemplaris]|uniref:Uncharacterized protein n=1 Tax=Hypsibius exemplaris TaxID=2072580 RepID=A0A1W0WY10_HYPEX|nr:hypothetical protein BV898_05881 [Hypsibius exemplaris]
MDDFRVAICFVKRVTGIRSVQVTLYLDYTASLESAEKHHKREAQEEDVAEFRVAPAGNLLRMITSAHTPPHLPHPLHSPSPPSSSLPPASSA